MTPTAIIANDRQARETSGVIEELSRALSSEQELNSILQGLPRVVIEGVRRSLTVERKELGDLLDAYHRAKAGNSDALRSRAGGDLGALLVVARVARGWTQKELARRLLVPEQQIQRYETERYRSVSLGNLARVARTLGVRLTADLSTSSQQQWLPSYEMSQADAQKVLRHARNNGWLERKNQSDENGLSELKRTVAEHVTEHGTPSLLRTGLNVENISSDWVMLAWKAQVTRKALSIFQENKKKYRLIDISWLRHLVALSAEAMGPMRAVSLLRDHGIIVVPEPQIQGMNIDGAAFLVEEIPVIGLTLRHDRLDNFWFTLLHELGHIVLHYRTGLSSGFFDDVTNNSVDEFEEEANEFASNLLIPEELWCRSAARIAKSAEPIERFARQIGIAPAIVFGRVRMERNNYTLFSDKIGTGKVRKQLLAIRSSESSE